MDLQEVGGSCGDWMELAQDRERWRALVSTVRNLRVPKMRRISSLATEPFSFSRRTLFHGVSNRFAFGNYFASSLRKARSLCCVTDSVIFTTERHKHTCILHQISCFCFGACLSVNSLNVSIIKPKLHREKLGVSVTSGVGWMDLISPNITGTKLKLLVWFLHY